MDREKQIEETYGYLKETYELSDIIYGYSIDTKGDADYVADVIIKQGYRKINENDVVISNETLENDLCSIEWHNEQVLKLQSDLENARKKTAREVLNCVKELYTTPYFCFHENLLKIAEKYGVDLDEQSTKCEYFREIDYGYRHSKQCYAQKCAPEVNCNGRISDCSKYPKITAEE